MLVCSNVKTYVVMVVVIVLAGLVVIVDLSLGFN